MGRWGCCVRCLGGLRGRPGGPTGAHLGVVVSAVGGGRERGRGEREADAEGEERQRQRRYVGVSGYRGGAFINDNWSYLSRQREG